MKRFFPWGWVNMTLLFNKTLHGSTFSDNPLTTNSAKRASAWIFKSITPNPPLQIKRKIMSHFTLVHVFFYLPPQM